MATATDIRGGRGHHYGWGRGRGHHYGWRHHLIDRFSWTLLSSSYCPDESNAGNVDGRADRRDQFSFSIAQACQPNPISTAIRIKSEWFLAPSFCLSSEVVLATVL